MGLSTQASDFPSEFDVVIVGAGTAGCTLAGRLSAADPSLSILLIEGGGNNKDNPAVTTPAFLFSNLGPDSKIATFYKAQPSEHVNGRAVVVPCGGVLGGGSSINFMMYTRAQGIDYESWDQPGWTMKDLLPLLRKTETFCEDRPAIDKSVHGYKGPIEISRPWISKSVEQEVMDAVNGMGYPEIVDLQDFKQCNGFSRWPKFIGLDGKRSDAASGFIHPLLEDGEHPNLNVLLESKVVRVVFEGKRASGVEFVPATGNESTTGDQRTVPRGVRAKKLVVVSAGSLSTPQILERSGIGDKELLSSLNIPLVEELPDVGANYQDHYLILHSYKTSLQPEQTIDGILNGRVDLEQARKDKSPVLGWNAFDVAGKVRPTEDEVDRLGTEFRELWDRDYKPHASRPLALLVILLGFLGNSEHVKQPAQYLTMDNITAYPLSRGSIHISGRSLEDAPNFEPGFLNNPVDIKALVWSYKKSREIARRLPCYCGEVPSTHPSFPPDSNAALVSFDDDDDVADTSNNENPTRRTHKPPAHPQPPTRDIDYSPADDAAIEHWIRATMGTTWHSCGTCAMKARDAGGVVDSRLNVHGVAALKLADLSIMPANVGANTNSTAFLIGEKAAEIVAGELGLDGF